MRNIITIFYDSSEFPQTQQYAEIWSIYCNDLNAMLRCGEIKPTVQNYTKIYFACSNRDKFKDIIDSHSRFDCEFISYIPDYRRYDVVEKAIALFNDGYTEPLSDIVRIEQKPVKEVKSNKVVNTPKLEEDEELDPDILKPRRRARRVRYAE